MNADNKRKYDQDSEESSESEDNEYEPMPADIEKQEQELHYAFLSHQIVETIQSGVLTTEDLESMHELCQERSVEYHDALKARVMAACDEMEAAQAAINALPASFGRHRASSRLLSVARKYERRYRLREARKAALNK